MKNWWDYHKWYVICGTVLLGIIIYLIGNAFGLYETEPDFQIAYVGGTALPEDTVSQLEQAFAEIGGDFNGDGKSIVKLNQYVDNAKSQSPEAAYDEYTSEIALIGDISDCDSYFFLMDDPEDFQREFQILAQPDGSCPDGLDYSADGKAFLWSDCAALSDLELGSYSVTALGEKTSGSSRELMSKLYIGRRCFFTDTKTKYAKQCNELWNAIITTVPKN